MGIISRLTFFILPEHRRYREGLKENTRKFRALLNQAKTQDEKWQIHSQAIKERADIVIEHMMSQPFSWDEALSAFERNANSHRGAYERTGSQAELIEAEFFERGAIELQRRRREQDDNHRR